MPRFLIKIISGILLCMIYFSVGATAENNMNQAQEAAALLNTLGVNTEAELSANSTRGQFLTSLMSIMGYTRISSAESDFSDIKSGTQLCNAATYALDIGIISPADKFYPENEITFNQAVKMGVEALGLGDKAASLGGYPYGYLRIAEEMELDDGISSRDVLTVADSYIFLSNLCEAETYSVASYGLTQGVSLYSFEEGKPFITVYQNVYIAEGIIDAANGSYLYDGNSWIDNKFVSVDEKMFTLSGDITANLGMNAKVYVRRTNSTYDEVIHITYCDNKVSRISAVQNPVFSNGKLSYTKSDGNTGYINSGALKTVIYNGKADGTFRDADFAISSGYIDAIDNNNDGRADVFSVWKPDYIEIGAIDVNKKAIYDVNYSRNIFAEDEDVLFISDISFESYSKGDIIEAYISKDGKYINVSLVKDTLTGVLSGIGDDCIFIDDIEYNTDPYFDSFYRTNLTFGQKTVFSVNNDGIIVAIKKYPVSGFVTGYFEDIAKETGLSESISIKVFNEYGELITPDLSDKLKVDDAPLTSSEAYDLLMTKKESLINYRINDEGKIIEIKTPMTEEGIYSPSADGFDSLKRFRFPNDETTSTVYYKTQGYFVPYFTINGSTVIIAVADDAQTDEEKFRLITNLDFIQNDKKVVSNLLKPYNVDESGHAAILLYKCNMSDISGTIGDRAKWGVVTECSEALTENYESVYKLVLYCSDNYETKYIKKDRKFIADMNLASGVLPYSNGDILRYTADGMYIESAIKDFDGATRNLMNSSGDNESCHYYYGKLYSVGSSSVAILRDDGVIVYVPLTLSNFCMIDTNDVYTAPKDSISTYKQVGNDASNILIKCRYSAAEHVFVVK